MQETPEELRELQDLPDASLSRSASYLRSITNTERTLTTERVAQILTGACAQVLSTVTAKGELRIGDVDAHFLHGEWHFGVARNANKTRHLATRSAAGAAYMRGEHLGVFTHGEVEILNPHDGEPVADWLDLLAYFKDFYGGDAFDWDKDGVYYRLHPHWTTGYAPDVAKLAAAAGPDQWQAASGPPCDGRSDKSRLVQLTTSGGRISVCSAWAEGLSAPCSAAL